MARPPRIFRPGTFTHIIARGNRRQLIFEAPEDYARYDERLRERFAEGGIPLIASCPMPNHVHAAAPNGLGDISAAMHDVLTSHGLYMNKKYGRKGHLFEDRFKSVEVPGGMDLAYLTRYIHNNPVRKKLVERAADWPWSTHRSYLDPSSDQPSGKHYVLPLFEGDPRGAIQAFSEFVDSGVEAPADFEGPPPLEKLAAWLERENGHVAGFLKSRSRRRDVTGLRARFIELAVKRGYMTKEIAEFLGCTPAAVNWTLRAHGAAG